MFPTTSLFAQNLQQKYLETQLQHHAKRLQHNRIPQQTFTHHPRETARQFAHHPHLQLQESCPLNGRCLQESVVYQAVVERQDNKEQQSYIGLKEGPFKLRYNNHNNTFRKEKHRNSTSLSKYMHLQLERQ